jgi:hypothetical protein
MLARGVQGLLFAMTKAMTKKIMSPPPTFLQVYSELIGNIMVDAASAGKYFHFVR